MYYSTCFTSAGPRPSHSSPCVGMQTRTPIASMGWLRLVGSIKLQVSFAEYSLFYRALLQKRPKISLISLTEATPCLGCMHSLLSMCMHHTYPCV